MTENLENNDDGAIRLQVALSRAGVASRRHAEELIREGRVRVDGNIVREMGVKVNPARQEILVNEMPLPKAASEKRTVMLNKPVGYLSAASDGHGGRCVTELVASIPARLVPVGRLDRDSCGLLLLSDDGDLIARVTHPRYNHQKVYHVDVSGLCDEETLATLQAPMDIDGYLLRPVGVSVLERYSENRTLLRFVLHEGRNRQIRKMCAQVGLNVISLMRVALDRLQLGELQPGQWRDLTTEEVETLRNGALDPVSAKEEKAPRGGGWDDFDADGKETRPRSPRAAERGARPFGRDGRKPFGGYGSRGRDDSFRRDDRRPFREDDRRGGSRRQDDRREDFGRRPSRWQDDRRDDFDRRGERSGRNDRDDRRHGWQDRRDDRDGFAPRQGDRRDSPRRDRDYERGDRGFPRRDRDFERGDRGFPRRDRDFERGDRFSRPEGSRGFAPRHGDRFESDRPSENRRDGGFRGGRKDFSSRSDDRGGRFSRKDSQGWKRGSDSSESSSRTGSRTAPRSTRFSRGTGI